MIKLTRFSTHRGWRHKGHLSQVWLDIGKAMSVELVEVTVCTYDAPEDSAVPGSPARSKAYATAVTFPVCVGNGEVLTEYVVETPSQVFTRVATQSSY